MRIKSLNKEMRVTQRNDPTIIYVIILLVLIWPGLVVALEQRPLSTQDFSNKYFKIQVVDRQTGRGVPLVELRTTNQIRYFTDSNGIVAFYEPGLMDREVFFFVESHGYEFPKDGFGYRGTRLKTSPGGSAVIKIDRLNIAERLYRITGQGIYRDSVLTGVPIPLKNPVLNGQVNGQDSVHTCIYSGRLFWLWGDTNRPSYPLGHFGAAGALSDLPEQGGLDPAVGVDLEYFVDEKGFSKPLCPLKEEGMVWLNALFTVADEQGRERMVARYSRMKSLEEALERGLVVYHDTTNSFKPVVRSGPDFLPLGHAISVDVDGRKYYYFTTSFPLVVRIRVRAKWDYVVDPNRYEFLTSLKPKEPNRRGELRLELGDSDKPYRWISVGELIDNDASSMPELIKKLKKEKQDTHLYDIESGKKISPHSGSVYFNAYRKRWVMIMQQTFGGPSFSGELWYAEADTPVGPWAYARKIVTHNKYTFYNPMQHPYFDQDGGRIIFFEGTYTSAFSGSAKNPTPRYDYNQIMYRLNLDNPRLALPVAVYQIYDEKGQSDYLLRDGVEKADKWNSIESIPFYALEPKRASNELIPIYAQKVPSKNGRTICLTANSPDSSANPLFYALPPSESVSENLCIVSLYEYRHTDTEQRLYSTNPVTRTRGWIRAGNPLCRVWKAPPGPLLLDSKATKQNLRALREIP